MRMIERCLQFGYSSVKVKNRARLLDNGSARFPVALLRHGSVKCSHNITTQPKHHLYQHSVTPQTPNAH